jgi:hypothetical protein
VIPGDENNSIEPFYNKLQRHGSRDRHHPQGSITTYAEDGFSAAESSNQRKSRSRENPRHPYL